MKMSASYLRSIAIVLIVLNATNIEVSLTLEENSPNVKAEVHEWDYFMSMYLEKFLVRRVIDTEGHAEVRGWITTFLEELGWSIELHQFNHSVPTMDDSMTGEKVFTNIIATLDPSKCQKVTHLLTLYL